MESKRVDRLITRLNDYRNTVDEKVGTKLELEKCERMIQKLSALSSNCEGCKQHFVEMEDHIIHLKEQSEQHVEVDYKLHKQKIDTISSHLLKKHKLVPTGYYLSVYMSFGLSLGVVFGLLIFDNIALGISLGIAVGVAIGAGLDAGAKNKGMIL